MNLAQLSTTRLYAMLKRARVGLFTPYWDDDTEQDYSFVESLKAELAKREHIPRPKAAKALRREQAKARHGRGKNRNR